MVERSLVSFVVLFAAMYYVTRVWQVLAIRAVQGLFAGYGALSVAMAAESAPRGGGPRRLGWSRRRSGLARVSDLSSVACSPASSVCGAHFSPRPRSTRR